MIVQCVHCGREYDNQTDICFYCGLGDDDASVHLNADKNLKPETAEALGEMIRYALAAIKQGKQFKNEQSQKAMIMYGETLFKCDNCGKQLVAFIGETPKGVCWECHEDLLEETQAQHEEDIAEYNAERLKEANEALRDAIIKRKRGD